MEDTKHHIKWSKRATAIIICLLGAALLHSVSGTSQDIHFTRMASKVTDTQRELYMETRIPGYLRQTRNNNIMCSLDNYKCELLTLMSNLAINIRLNLDSSNMPSNFVDSISLPVHVYQIITFYLPVCINVNYLSYCAKFKSYRSSLSGLVRNIPYPECYTMCPKNTFRYLP